MIYFQTFPVCDAVVSIFNDSMMKHPDLTIARNFISFTSQQLDLDRVYNVNVTAENFDGSAMSQTRIRKQGMTICAC